MFHGDLYHYIPLAFGLRKSMLVLRSHDFFDDHGQKIESANIISYWIAEVSYFQPDIPRDELVVACLRTNKWLKGAIIIPQKDQYFVPSSTPSNPKIIQSIDITAWDEPVSKALQCLNVFIEDDLAIRTGPYMYHANIKYATNASLGEISVGPGPRNIPSFDNLWFAIHKTIQHLAELSGDAEVQRYISEPIRR